MRKILHLLVLFLLLTPVRADEGMWLPSLISEGRLKDMRSKGFRLSAEDIYSVNQSSLKDAIVRFGSGCTGEVISDQGLLITNHHCGYGQIQKHSSVQHDYLTYGFAAMKPGEELPNEGLVVTFLVEMRDVTDEVLKNGRDAQTIKANREKIVKKATKGNHYKASVEALYYGNQYFLFIYEVFEDVRLVFAPPSAIGKFGGDTDNWMWPRHTGDFSLFRIYAGKDNKPAKYSPDNVPYKPKKSFTISTKGVQPGDFTFVYGFPARTSGYLHSKAVEYILEKSDPFKVEMRTIRLRIMNEAMAKDPGTRIKYAAKNARVSNAWKKWQGEMKGLERLRTVNRKQRYEEVFESWAAHHPEYQGVTKELGKLYDSIERTAFEKDRLTEAFWGVEIFNFMKPFASLTPERLDSADTRQKLIKSVNDFYKDYDREIDYAIAQELLWKAYNDLTSGGFRPDPYIAFGKQSIFMDRERLIGILENPDAKKAIETLRQDPHSGMEMIRQQVEYEKNLNQELDLRNARITALYETYMRGMMEMEKNTREFYPDANSTLRVAYGTIDGYKPKDAVRYCVQTTLEGVMEKDNPEIYDYNVPEKLRKLYRSKDYGRWGTEIDGTLTVPVAFIASNHTTGGNSGSPVLNGNGELIGVNFDRCWEGTMSDVEYDPLMCRNIAIDIRYALFLIDKVGGAGYLLDEMKFSTEQ